MSSPNSRFKVGQSVTAKFWEGRVVERLGTVKGFVREADVLVHFEGFKNPVLVSRCGLSACLVKTEGGEL